MARPMATRCRWPPERALGLRSRYWVMSRISAASRTFRSISSLGVFFSFREGHVLVYRHMGVQGVVLEDHGDVPILGLYIVHELIADVQLTIADLLQTGNHAQGGGLAAAGGSDQNDKLLVGNLQVELLHGHDALGRDLQVGFFDLLALFAFLFLLCVGVDFLQVLENDFCHFT